MARDHECRRGNDSGLSDNGEDRGGVAESGREPNNLFVVNDVSGKSSPSSSAVAAALVPALASVDGDGSLPPQQRLARLEQELYGAAKTGGLIPRLQALERGSYGSEQEGGLLPRLTALEEALLVSTGLSV